MASGYYGYVLFQAERSKTTAELRAEDARRGELAAALSRASAVLTAALQRPFRWRRASRPVAPVVTIAFALQAGGVTPAGCAACRAGGRRD
jgi:hypothetical protein